MRVLRGNRQWKIGNRRDKRGAMLQHVVIHIILVGIIFAVFLMAVAGQVNGRGVKQQVLEKQMALLIDSSEAGMSFEISKMNVNGIISDVEIKNGRVFVVVEGLSSVKGYSYFSKHVVSVEEEEGKFVVFIKK